MDKDKYQKLNKLGEGTYGVVYKALDLTTEHQRVVAVKMTRLDSEEEKGAPPTTIREISVLKRMDHPNIVRLLDVVRADGRELHLVFEYLDHDLRTYTGEFSVGPDMVKKFMRDLIRGILYCHSNGVLHRDIKPENLLIDGEGNLKIADFGLARAFGVPLREYTNRVASRWYRCPELLLGARRYSTGVDMWSVGCTFAQMCTGKPLFPGKTEMDQIVKIFSVLGTPTEDDWPAVTSIPNFERPVRKWKRIFGPHIVPGLDEHGFALLSDLLAYDPVRRISAKRASIHAYFANGTEAMRGGK